MNQVVDDLLTRLPTYDLQPFWTQHVVSPFGRFFSTFGPISVFLVKASCHNVANRVGDSSLIEWVVFLGVLPLLVKV